MPTCCSAPRRSARRPWLKAYAQALLCTHPSERPCHRCRACDLVARNAHPDVQLFQPRTKLPNKDDTVVDRMDGKILADQADVLVHDAALRPVEGRYRILLIQDVHRANDTFPEQGAQDARRAAALTRSCC